MHAETMLLAYADPKGVTAAFYLNLLARIIRELEGDFVLRHFNHEVRYQDVHRRIEVHLRPTKNQTISIRAADFTCTLNEGETIWTEACHNSASKRFLVSPDGRDSFAKRNGSLFFFLSTCFNRRLRSAQE